LVFLSDETIRRWSRPVTRIDASRRARAGAAQLGDDFMSLLGKVEKAGERVMSANFGTLGFRIHGDDRQTGGITV
jgi:hypothetical protein